MHSSNALQYCGGVFKVFTVFQHNIWDVPGMILLWQPLPILMVSTSSLLWSAVNICWYRWGFESRRSAAPLRHIHAYIQHNTHYLLGNKKSKQKVRKDVNQAYTVKPELAVTSIKQPTCHKQPNRMFPNFVLISTSAKQPPALSSHYLCFPWVAA